LIPAVWDPLWPLTDQFTAGKGILKIQVTTVKKRMLVPKREISDLCGDQLNDTPLNV